MDAEFVTLTPENLAQETLCCIVRTRTKHPGVEAKRAWLAERLPEGHVFCKLRGNGCAFVEYAPLETAWVPVLGENYLYLYCPLGAGRAEGAGLWPGADGALHCRRTGQRPCGRLYAGREGAEGMAL